MGDYIFRTKYSAVLEGKSSVAYIMNTLKPKRIAFMYQNSDYGKGVFKAFGDELEKNNSSVIFSDSYEVGGIDVRTALAKIQSSNPDIVILAGFPKEIGLILKQAGEINIHTQFVAHSGSIGPDIVKIAGKSASGLMYLTELNKSTDEFKKFSLIYKKKYGVEPELVSSSSYDTTNLILQSGKECGTLQNADCVKKHLAKIKDYNGVSGSITFDENGDVSDRGMVCLRKDVRMEGDKLADIDIPCE
jgi:branched-chain amino acid transport system substrate-binding protein